MQETKKIDSPIEKSTKYRNDLSHKLVYWYDLLTVLVLRDLKLRYKRSVAGLAWSLLNPLAELLILSFVFGTLLNSRIPHFNVFLFTGLLAWNWFSGSLNSASGVVVNNTELVRQPGFPLVALPVATINTHFIHFLLALPILFIFILLDDLPITLSVLVSPFVMAVQFLFTLSLVYFLAAWQVTFQDTQYLLKIALRLGFFISAIFYDPAMIAEEYQWIFNLNPMVILITDYRTIFLDGQVPDLMPLFILIVISSVLLYWGLRVFNNTRHTFAEVL